MTKFISNHDAICSIYPFRWQETPRHTSFAELAGNDRSRMRTKFGNELMLPSRARPQELDRRLSAQTATYYTRLGSFTFGYA